jgi:acyl-CoA synthetase (AMP-forming)/AMP-acid ligase II
MLTHRNLIANCAQVGASERLKGIVPADVVVLVLPLFHIYALNVGLTIALRAGATIVLVARFEPAAVLEAIQRHRCTIFLGAPPMYVAWVTMPDLASYDLSSLRVAFSGAAPLPAAVLERFAHALPEETPGTFRRHNLEPFASGMQPSEWTNIDADISDWVGAVCRGLEANRPPAEVIALHPIHRTSANSHGCLARSSSNSAGGR